MASTTGITDIPEEILISKIFMKTPASCITDTTRSVCRRWRQLTTDDPYFVRSHVDAHRTMEKEVESSIVVFQYYRTPWSIEKDRDDGFLHLGKLDIHQNPHVSDLKIRAPIPAGSGFTFVRARASCDGLLCFQFYPKKTTGRPMTSLEPYYICNPLLKSSWTCVPPSPVHKRQLSSSSSAIGLYSACLCGFYFHRTTGEYRLLQHSFTAEVNIYEVCSAVGGGNNNSWRTIYEFPLLDEDPFVEHTLEGGRFLHKISINLNQGLHWLVDDSKIHQLTILKFDTESEKFTFILGPDINSSCNVRKLNMYKMGGNLCIGHVVEDRGSQIMQLWMMNDCNQWVRLHTICSDGKGFAMTRRLVPKPVHEVDEELLVAWNFGDSYTLYNFKLKTHKTIDLKRFYDCHAFDLRYKESLLDPRAS